MKPLDAAVAVLKKSRKKEGLTRKEVLEGIDANGITVEGKTPVAAAMSDAATAGKVVDGWKISRAGRGRYVAEKAEG